MKGFEMKTNTGESSEQFDNNLKWPIKVPKEDERGVTLILNQILKGIKIKYLLRWRKLNRLID